MANEWAIMDDDGIIYSGTEEEMRDMFKRQKSRIYEENEIIGDLRLIEIHDRHS